MGTTDIKTLTARITRMIDNPFEADGEFYHQRLSDPTYNGRITVTSNELTRIGALCFIPHRLPHHEMSAQRFKNEYEALYGNVTPAVDPSVVPVDTSTRHDSATNNMVSRIDRADSIRLIVHGSKDRPPVLDAADLHLLISAICMEVPSSQMVSIMPSGKPNWRHVQARDRRLLYVLTLVSKFYGYAGREAA